MALQRYVKPVLDGDTLNLPSTRVRHLLFKSGEYATPFWVTVDGDTANAIQVTSLPYTVQMSMGNLATDSSEPPFGQTIIPATVVGTWAGQATATQVASNQTVTPATIAATWAVQNDINTTEWPDNEPAGMATFLSADGSAKYFDASATYGSRWDSHVTSVSDGDSRYGNAINKPFLIGDPSAWNGTAHRNNWDQGYRYVYVRLIFKYSSNWDFHDSGAHKMFFIGYRGSGAATAYPINTRGSSAPMKIQFTNQAGADEGSDSGIWVAQDSAISLDQYYTLEAYLIAQSSPGSSDASFQMWLDGTELTDWTTVGGTPRAVTGLQLLDSGASDTNWDGYQSFLYWGGSGDTKTVNDWFRISEFYVAVKPTSITWDCGNLITDASGCDLLPITWSDDDKQYIAWGDGNGFEGASKKSYGIASLSGAATSYTAADILYGPSGSGGGKIFSMVSVGGVLYIAFNPQTAASRDMRKSTDKAQTMGSAIFTWDWGGDDYVVTFIQHGQDNALSDGYVYATAARENDNNPSYLLRVLEANIETKASWEWFTGSPSAPSWGAFADRAGIYTGPTHPAKYRVCTWCPGAQRYLLTANKADDPGNWKILIGPNPYGPWTEIEDYTNWCSLAESISALYFRFLAPKWFSGWDIWQIFSGTGTWDRFNLMKGTLAF